MLRRKELFYISEGLKEMKGNDLLFGGLCVVQVVDPVQLPPVMAESLWIKDLPNTKPEDVNKITIYKQFSDVVILKENNRLDEMDPESVKFNKILGMIREGKMSKRKRQVKI